MLWEVISLLESHPAGQEQSCIIHPELLFGKPVLSLYMLFRKGWPCWLARCPGLAHQSTPPLCPSWLVQPWLGQVRPVRGLLWHREPDLLGKTTLSQGLQVIRMRWGPAACSVSPRRLKEMCADCKNRNRQHWSPGNDVSQQPSENDFSVRWANVGLISGLFWVWLPSFTTRRVLINTSLINSPFNCLII